MDIRTAKDFEKEHIPGAINVPLFVPVVGSEVFDQIKKFVMATAFAMTATGALALHESCFAGSLDCVGVDRRKPMLNKEASCIVQSAARPLQQTRRRRSSRTSRSLCTAPAAAR